MHGDWVNKRGLDLSKEVLWVSVDQRAADLQAVKDGDLKKILPRSQPRTLRKVFYQRNESSYGCRGHSVPASSSNQKLRFPWRKWIVALSWPELEIIRASKRTVGWCITSIRVCDCHRRCILKLKVHSSIRKLSFVLLINTFVKIPKVGLGTWS